MTDIETILGDFDRLSNELDRRVKRLGRTLKGLEATLTGLEAKLGGRAPSALLSFNRFALALLPAKATLSTVS